MVTTGVPTNGRVRALMLASAVSLIVGACSSASPPASDTAGSTSSAAASAAASATLAGSASPTKAPTPSPLPTLPSTTEEATEAPEGAISITMTFAGAPRFEPDRVTAKTGPVVFFLQNVSVAGFRLDHDMLIGPKVYKVLAGTPRVKPDASVIFTVDGLTPGTYAFWCQVPPHAANGMVGTLTITP